MALSDYVIKLDQFLKAIGIAQTGGQAKLIIQKGQVRVNDIIEIRRGRKLIPGDRVAVNQKTFVVETNIT